MIGHEPIISMRMNRKKPAAVHVWVGKPLHSSAKDWHLHNTGPEVDILPDENIDSLDLRWSVGLIVMVHGTDTTERMEKAYEAFKRAKAGWVVATIGDTIIDSLGKFDEHNH